MKKIKLQVLAQINVLIGAALALLGCGSNKKMAAENQIVCLYGVPTATYHVSGTVTDGQRKPLQDMQVVVKGYKNYPITDTLRTDDKGKYDATYNGYPADTLNIVVADPQGEYASDSAQVAVPWNENANGFDQGEQTFKQNIQLKKK